jgi:hypothetical protein
MPHTLVAVDSLMLQVWDLGSERLMQQVLWLML